MDEEITGQISRSALLKTAGLLGAGGALALGLPGRAGAAHGLTHTQVYLQSYVRANSGPAAGLVLLVQGSAFNVSALALGTPGVVDLGPDPITGLKGMGFDVELGAAVVGNNSDKKKGQDPSFCVLEFTKGALNGFPPINGGGQDAIRLEGAVIESGDPANIGVPVKLHAFSGLTVTSGHNICRIKFEFGAPEFTFWGVGLALVNT